ncbi:SpoIIE family protein phosphatase [Streptomyces sp. NBC_01483]|uniref:SpoIIE family protein phosphatase n=1 Tax=Streptomyces sp. NBC_01483 TaxID=2903883 RepID=UPI003FCCC186
MPESGEGPGTELCIGTEEEASDAAAIVTLAGTVLGWTRSAEELLGRAAHEVVGGSVGRLLAMPEDPHRLTEIVKRCRGGRPWSGMVTLWHGDGRRVEVNLRVSASFEVGGVECFLVSARERITRWAMGQSVLDGFLTRSPVGMAIVDMDLRCVWCNSTLESIGGVPREQRLGRRLSDLLPGLEGETIEGVMRKVLRTGEPVSDFEYLGWCWADPHRQHAYSTSFFPLVDAEGTVTGICYMVLDVTDRWNARQLLSMVNDAGACVGSTLDVMETAQELADFAVPRFADFTVVDLLEPVLSTERHGTWLSDAGPPTAPLMRRAGMRSVRDGCPEAVARVGDPVDFIPPPHDLGLLVNGDPVLIPVLNPDSPQWIVEQPSRTSAIREFGLHSLISVPMRARDTVLGLTTFIRSENPAPFTSDDVLLARELVARAAVCVDNARRYTREHHATLTLQHSLLPHTLEGGMAVDVASMYLPADAKDGVGGDWFDVIPLSGARVGLVVGDVVGHGLSAAATMGRLRTAVQTLADMDLPPDELLAHLDDLVLRLSEEESHDASADLIRTTVMGATCLYAIYDPVTRNCTLARAGHLPPVLVTPQGGVSFPELPPGPPLGLGGLPFEAVDIELAENSLIGLYTNGLIKDDAQDVDVGMARLGDVLARCDLPLETLCADVRGLTSTPQSDDVAFLVARTHALSADRVASWDVACDPAAVAGARALATRQLREWGMEELTMQTELVVSELVTNAVRYAPGAVRLRLLRASRLICEVTDTSNSSPRLRHARTTDEGGRGLFLVAQLAHRWGTRYTHEGKIIWAELDS